MKACRQALRSIDYKRNRGLGAVRCTLDREHSADVGTVEYFAAPDTYDADKNYLIEYKIRLDADVAVSRSDTGDSEDFIPGSAVLGAAAAKFAALPDSGKPDFSKVYFSQIPNKSQHQRLSLMADNSLKKQFTAEKMEAEHYRWKDFEKRIDSIKNESAKDKAKELKKRINDTCKGEDSAKLKCMIIFLHILRYRAKSEGGAE